MAKKFGKFLMFSAAVAAAAGAYYYFKKSDEDRFDDDDFDNDFDFDEEEKDLSGGKERSYVPLRFSTVKSEKETAAEEAKEDVPAVEEVKRDIIRNYPYMNLFVTLAFREEKEILTLIADSMDQYSTMLSGIYQKADLSCFKTGIDASAVLKMCLFVADGVLNEQFRNDSIDAESYFTEVESYLQLLEENMCW